MRFGAKLAAVLGMVGCAAGVHAGPDVIVGDLYEVANYTSSGAIGGMRAYAVGTISCNIGTSQLTWISNNNQHPVISQNMYRLNNGRFEQIGQAWLKHGFCALQGNVCSDCTPNPTGCPALGVGCSDPYSAGLNGTQSGLGPKWQVNASTGYFPYPYTDGSGSGTLHKRLQVPDAKMGTAGAQYFVSSIYIQPEDAAGGNDNNNQSYRRVNVNATNKDISLADSTQRTKAAIYAWRDYGGGVNAGGGIVDPNVKISPIDIAGDGRFLVGAKATDLGNGTWRYEYAIQNLNSDRSGAGFSIPVPAGAVVTNTGFSDIAYHSGEPYNSTDWAITVSSTSVSWDCTQTFAQNANANALRWDTIYNFWFDCNIPPAPGTGTLKLFKTVSNATYSGVTPSADGQFHPFNDTCAAADDVGEGVVAFNSTGASTDGPVVAGACIVANYNQIGADLWYRYTAGYTGNVTISTCGSSFDTKLAVYAGSCPAPDGLPLVCDDDSGGCGTGSAVSFAATAGAIYYVRVGGYNAAAGAGTFTISNSGAPQPLVNDNCSNAVWLTDNVAYSGSTSEATNDGTATCGSSDASKDVWFKYKPVTSGTITVVTAGSSYDTVLSAYTGTCASRTQVACNDDVNNTLQSSISFSGVAGTTYLIRVAGYQTAAGAYTVKVTGGGGGAPPINDDCSGRSGISLGTTNFNTSFASTDGPAHAGGTIARDIWFNYPSQCTGTLTVTTCGSSFDSALAVYTGAGCTNLTGRLAGFDNNGGNCGVGAKVTIPVVAGQNYTIRVGSIAGTGGTGTLNLDCQAYCPGDFNRDGFVDGFDYDDFVTCFETNVCPSGRTADFNNDGFVDGFDYDDYISAFEGACP